MERLEQDADPLPAKRGQPVFIQITEILAIDANGAQVGRSIPPITASRVDLPDPDGPTTLTELPSATSRPRRAGS